MIMLTRSSEMIIFTQIRYAGDNNNRGVQIEGKSDTDKVQHFPYCILAANFPLMYISGSGLYCMMYITYE